MTLGKAAEFQKEIGMSKIHFLETPAPAGDAPSSRLLSTVAGWLENQKARCTLFRSAALDPRFAADIGLTPDEIEWECSAPFWVAISSRACARPAGRSALDRTTGRHEIRGRRIDSW